ncbi:MAG: hypothetical protein IJH37_13000 [Clostridia bacterium]|nr:hypothetical protein [Clostridia bacterium]
MRSKTETITLGSGKLYYSEFTDGTVPANDTLCVDANLLGRIKGGATLTYTPTFYDASDDMGYVQKSIITDEEAILKSGLITWNGETLKALTSTARVTTSAATASKPGTRTVKIGGVANNDGKKYVLCFHHEDAADGDVWVKIVGTCRSGFELTFAKDAETTINAEFKAMPQDDTGTLIEYTEKTANKTSGN